MSRYLDTKIREINDASFQLMVGELCHCLDKNPDLFRDQPLRYLLMVIGMEDPKVLSTKFLPGPGILTTKVDDLSPDSVVHAVCRELVDLKKGNIEEFDRKTVLHLIGKCYKASFPQIARQRKPTRLESRQQHTTNLIKRRRENGSL